MVATVFSLHSQSMVLGDETLYGLTTAQLNILDKALDMINLNEKETNVQEK
jgi:hypothetical protein